MTSLTGLSPNNPLVYVGPNVAINTVVTRNRAPTGADYRQPETGKLYPFNTFWLVGKNPTTGIQGDLWYLSKIVSNVAFWIQLGSAMGFLQITQQHFTSTGTYTPTAGMKYCIIECVGAGGGGGGAQGGISGAAAGSGGGAGGYHKSVFTAAQIGTSQAVTIGAGGAGGANTGGNGANGGTTSVGSLITATGGNAGLGAASSSAGTTTGGQGGSGNTISGDYKARGTDGGASMWIVSAGFCIAGAPGISPLGSGGPFQRFIVAPGPANGQSPGLASFGTAGGGGASLLSATGATGGIGADGFVYITEYI